MRYHPAQRSIVWTVLFSLFTILSLNACSDANNVTGPPPPVPLSPDAKLSSLTVNTGPLDPVFSGDIANYAVNVATPVGSVTVTARPQNTNASMTINGQATASGQARAITLGAAGLNTLIPIVVTAVSGSQNTYFVTVNRAAPGGNNNLQSLTVSPGPLVPLFVAATTSYTVDVGTSVTSVTVTARAQDAGASVSINGQPTTSRSVSLGAAGSSTPISIEVTAPNGSQKTYVVTVNRAALGGNNNLQSLTVTPGPLIPAFAASTTSYTVNVAVTVVSVTVTARAQDAGASVSIAGQPTTSQSVALGAPGSSTVISTEVTAPNGSPRTYLVTVNRAALGGDNNLRSLTVTSGSLVPAFAAGTTSYTVDVATSVTNVTVTAQAQDAGATVSINNQTTTSLSVPLGAAGTNTPIQIEVTAPNGSQKTYVVTVNRAALGGNNNLRSLTVTSGSLVPAFAAGTTSYTVDVATSVTNVTVTAQAQDAGATVSINNQTTTSLSVPLGAAGTNTPIQVEVTAPNGSQKTYVVTVNRAALGGNNNLQSLTVSPGSLVPTFAANRLVYTVNVASTVNSVTVTAQPQDAGATVIIAGQPTTSRSVSLGAPDSSTEILIEVTAPNGNEKTYAVTVNRAAFIPSGNNNLSALAVSAGALNEPFDAGTLNYTVTLASTTADTTVTATVADPTATLTINGLPATSGAPSTSIPLVGGANPPIPVVVTAENLTTKTYTITITVVP